MVLIILRVAFDHGAYCNKSQEGQRFTMREGSRTVGTGVVLKIIE